MTGRPARPRAAKTLVEMMVVLGCLLLLLAVVIPLVASSRERSRRLTCANNLRQIGIGLHSFHSARRSFPPGRDAKNDWQHNWATHLLPYIERSELAELYSFQHAWNEESPGCQNRQVATSLVSLYRCPATEHSAPGEGDYGGNYGTQLTGLKAGFGRLEAWGSGVLVSINVPEKSTQPITMGQVRDGSSQTFLVMECAGNSAELGGSWACGHHNVAHDSERINALRSLNIFSDHPGGAHALFCDGGVRFLSKEADSKTVGAMCTRLGRELISSEKYLE